MKIIIHYYNELYLKVQTEQSVEYELQDEFSFFANNYKFNPKFKYGIWDGKIRLYNRRERTLYIGLLYDLFAFAKRKKYTLEFANKKDFSTDIKLDTEWLNSFEENSIVYNFKDYQKKSVVEAIKNNKLLVLSPTGCHAKGQQVIMYDGTLKNVEDIVVGDVLLAPDSTKRNVLKLFSGKSEMRTIVPVKGESFTVNKEHILSLRHTQNKKIVNISVEDYELKSNNFKHLHKLYRCDSVNFVNQPVNLDPYLMGVLLGDGSFLHNAVTLTSSDVETIQAFDEYSVETNSRLSFNRKGDSDTYTIRLCENENHMKNILIDYDLWGKRSSEKHIPSQYKINDVDTRLSILAGLIDTDGYVSDNCIEYSSASETLANDVMFITRSLGLACYKKVVSRCATNIKDPIYRDYYTLSISGNTDIIPTRIKRKQCTTRMQKKNVLNTGFSVKKLQIDDYYGFMLDKDHLYLLNDFTVTHNSGKSLVVYTLARFLVDNGHLDNGNRLLINVPSINLVNQLYQDFIDYTKDDFNVSDYVTRASGENKEDITKKIVISTWQSSMRKKPSYFENIYGYILDEAHQATANEITKIFDNLVNCKFRVGTTGTLDGTDLHELGMRARFGKLYRAATTKQLMEAGDLAKLNVKCHVLKYSDDDIKSMRKLTRGKQGADKYKAEIDFVVEHKKRNEFLKCLGFSQTENTLMLFNYVDKHGKILYDEMVKRGDEHLKMVFLIHGKVKGQEREIIRQTLDMKQPLWYDVYIDKDTFIRFKSNAYVKCVGHSELVPVYELKKFSIICKEWLLETIDRYSLYSVGNITNTKIFNVVKRKGSSILLASYGTLAVGVNIKNLHNLVLCHPTKSQIRLLQSIGRILRKANDKNEVTVYDVTDDMIHTTKKSKFVNTLYKQFITRLDIYEKEEFMYSIDEINLDN